MLHLRATLVLLGTLLCASNSALAQNADSSLPLVPDSEILGELQAAPRDNVERVRKLRDLYIQAGAKPEEIRLQEVKGGGEKYPVLHNVIVTKQGATDSVIVVGGHLDKVEIGDGIIDDWSGACLASNLYQTLHTVPTNHTLVFIGFAYEEHGLLGSRAYVNALTGNERGKIRAMINLECLGVDGPFIWTNGSSDSLELIAHEVAQSYELPLRDHKLLGVGADSIPFDRVGIPNITFDGLPVEQFSFIHSERDTFDNINQGVYLRTYQLAARFLETLDRRLGECPTLLPSLDPKTPKMVDAYVEAEMAKRHIPGLSVAVVQNGKVILGKGYGLANVELAVPATADTVYQIGSITKQFTASAIMLLAREGSLSLDDPIGRHVPGTPDTWKDITIRHLLNHTSGIKSYTNIEENMKRARLDRSRNEIVDTIRNLPLEFQPGEKWAYNNTGYFLLGLIIENVSGKSYQEFLNERIFRPLEMDATLVNRQSAVVRNRATGYGWGKSCSSCGSRVAAGNCRVCDTPLAADSQPRMLNAEVTSMTWPFSAGAIVSTVGDLAKWDAALYSESILRDPELRAMWTPTTLNEGKRSDYGLGWAVGRYRTQRVVGHGGGISGFATDIARFVDQKLTVIVLSNAENSNPASIGRGIAAFYIPDLASPQGSPSEDPKVTELLRGVLQATIEGKLDPELFTPEMWKEIFPDRVKQAREFLGQQGSLRSFVLVERRDEGETRTVRYKVEFSETSVILTAVFDKSGKISGLTITPD